MIFSKRGAVTPTQNFTAENANLVETGKLLLKRSKLKIRQNI